MTPRLLLEPEAQAEFFEAAGWYAERSPAIGAASVSSLSRSLPRRPARFRFPLEPAGKAWVKHG